MSDNRITAVLVVGLLLGVTVAPAAAAAEPTAVDECTNADRGPGGAGPPGFVADLVPNVISELIGGLPVPNVVKSFFGASTC